MTIPTTLFAAACKGGGFLACPPGICIWKGTTDAAGNCSPTITGINDIWLIVAAVIEFCSRIAVLVAVFFVMYGGVKYITNHITSNPAPEELVKARRSIFNALIGCSGCHGGGWNSPIYCRRNQLMFNKLLGASLWFAAAIPMQGMVGKRARRAFQKLPPQFSA